MYKMRNAAANLNGGTTREKDQYICLLTYIAQLLQ